MLRVAEGSAQGAGTGTGIASSSKQTETHTYPEGAARADGRVFGTYLHGVFHNDAWRRAWLDGLRMTKGLEPLNVTFVSSTRKEEAFDRLAEQVRRHLRMDLIYNIAGI